MHIQKTIALVTAPIGLIFLVIDKSFLHNIIVRTGLDWHATFLPIALGIILGALAGRLRMDSLQQAIQGVVYICTALFTFAVVASLAIVFEHGHWFLAMPTLWLASAAVGLYAFFTTQVRFSERYRKAKEDQQQRKDK